MAVRGKLDRQDAKNRLRTLDLLVMRSQLRADASPFLGLALSAKELPDARAALRGLSDWQLEELLKKFCYAISWAICAKLSEEYGADGNAKVWPLVEDLLGRTVRTQDERRAVTASFIRTCRKLGLASDGFDRAVQAFQIHAGVSRSQLQHLAKAFIAQERSLGLPDQDDIVLLNRWEDDALHFLDAGIQVLQRPILMDHSAWMASAYVDWRRDPNAFASKTDYLIHFGEQLASAFSGGSGGAVRAAPVPRLVWDDGRPQLSIPGQSQRFKLFLDGIPHRVRPGRLWPLPYPLPKEVTWEGDQPGRIGVFQNAGFVLFDSNTGRQVDISERSIQGEKKLSGIVATAVVVAKERFQIAGQPTQEIAPGLFAAHVDLRSGHVAVTQGSQRWLLSGVRRPQISITSRPVARGIGSPHMWSADAEIELDFGSSELLAGHTDGTQRPAFVKVEANGSEVDVEVRVDGRGIAVVRLADLMGLAHMDVDADPLSVSLTLLRSSGVIEQAIKTRFKRKLVVWPGFIEQTGLAISSKLPPQNFVPSESQHVSQDDQGQVCLDRNGGYSEGRMAFRLDGRITYFTVRPKMLSGVLERVDGTITPWRLGDVLVTGSATRSDALVLTSPDENASLKIGARSLLGAFRERPTYAIPLATVDGGDIIHISGEGLPTLVATIEGALEPTHVNVRTWSGGTRLSIEMPFKVGGVKVQLSTENGERDESEISFDHLPTEAPTQFWLKDVKSIETRITIQVDGHSLTGLCLLKLRVRRMGESEWFQLSNPRSDHYAFPLVGGIEGVNGPKQLTQLERWLAACYAPVAWESSLGSLLQKRWSEVIQAMISMPGGPGRLLLLAMKDDVPDWLPMVHVVQEFPALFAEPPISFHVFSDSSGAERILRIISDAAVARLRTLDIALEALLAFPNANTADKAGEKLRNFRPSNLPVIFSTLFEKPAAWMGSAALGPDHAATALALLQDRIEAHEVLGAGDAEGRMSLRSLNLNRVASVLRDSELSDRLLSSDGGQDASVQMIEQALLAFAMASRRGPEAVEALVGKASDALQESAFEVLGTIGEMLRLGRELFMFHLIAAEIEVRSNS